MVGDNLVLKQENGKQSSLFKNFLFFCIFIWQILPRGMFRLKVGGAMVDAPQLIAILLALSWVFKKFIISIAKGRKIILAHNGVSPVLLLLIFVQLCSILVSEDVWVSFRMWVVNVFTLYFIFFVIADEIVTIEDSKTVFKIIFFAAIIISIAGWYEYFTGINIFVEIVKFVNRDNISQNLYDENIRIDEYAKIRIVGPYGTPILLSQYFALVIFVVAYSLRLKRTLWNRFLISSAIIFIAIALIFTVTRASIAAVTFSFIFFVFVNVYFSKFGKLVRFLMVSFALISIILFFGTRFIGTDYIKQKIGAIVYNMKETNTSEYGHVYGLINMAPAIFKKDRFFIGYGTGVVEKHQLIGSEMLSAAGDLPDNWTSSIYHVFILESGVVGLILYLIIVLKSFFSLISVFRRTNDIGIRKMVSGIYLSILSYSLSAMFFQAREELFIFFILLGLVPCFVKNRQFINHKYTQSEI